MKYFLALIVLLACIFGVSYQHKQDELTIANLQQQVTDLTSKNDDLKSQITTLNEDKVRMTSDLKAANDKLTAATAAPAPPPAPPAATGLPGLPAASASVPVPVSTAANFTPTSTTTAPTPAVATPGNDPKALLNRATVLIRGDNGEGTGFLVQTPDGPAILTNLHVIAANPNLKITANSGMAIVPMGLKGAKDRDLALLTIKDAGYTYLPLAQNLNNIVAGDDVITPGNSQGGGVMLNTSGKVVAIGPDRVEIDNPIYHGNSGGPIFDVKTGTVIGVVTEAMKVDIGDDLDKASFASRNSSIKTSMRYFGLRLDTVPGWEAYDPVIFLNQTTFLENFHQQSLRLDSYLNPPKAGDADAASAKLYLNDAKIVKANDALVDRIGAHMDTASNIDILRQFAFDLEAIADQDMTPIQNQGNFYSYEQTLAHDEWVYRQALHKEIESFSSDINRMGGLVRKN
jgi:hypothetical protein